MAAVATEERSKNCLSMTRGCPGSIDRAAKESGRTEICNRAFGRITDEGASGITRFSSAIVTTEPSNIRIATQILVLSMPHWTLATTELRRHVRLMHHRSARHGLPFAGSGISKTEMELKFVQKRRIPRHQRTWTGTGPMRLLSESSIAQLSFRRLLVVRFGVDA